MALRDKNGRFVRKEAAAELRASGRTDDEIQALLSEHGLEEARRRLIVKSTLPGLAAAPGLRYPVKRSTPYRRVLRTIYDEATDTIRYLHATKGWRTRRMTPELSR